MAKCLPTYFISHGGGPWPYMKAETGGMFDRLEASLVAIARELGGKPRAVLVVTGHWEAPAFTVQIAARPGMVYDYSGFPPHTYEVVYPAPGEPALAARAGALLRAAGLPTAEDAHRGFDHGTFTPLVAMYPAADVPVVQVSVVAGYDPELHLAAGRALAPLRDEGVLIVGSGLSYHNLRRMGPAAQAPSRRFDAWLQDSLLTQPPATRTARLRAWEAAPDARACHPAEDHLIPLMAAVGAAEDEPAALVYHEEAFFGGVVASSFRFGAVPA
ncbi:MAG: class III extradiol ring-cleavage dioxygenase [Candidatus Sericytochromatia bacterium]|nr:class III extradiol ring-cleavage dioxygenase [Candidatus Sericytochromatia bacterium]